MKKILKLTLAILPVILLSMAATTLAQPPNPPDPPGHGKGGNQGKGAPIDGGALTFLALTAAYGAWKTLAKKRRE